MGMLDGIGGTGILSTMKYVNIDQQLPRIGIRQQQAMGLKNGYVPAEMHRDISIIRILPRPMVRRDSRI